MSVESDVGIKAGWHLFFAEKSYKQLSDMVDENPYDNYRKAAYDTRRIITENTELDPAQVYLDCYRFYVRVYPPDRAGGRKSKRRKSKRRKSKRIKSKRRSNLTKRHSDL